jgi:hypothetical protein
MAIFQQRGLSQLLALAGLQNQSRKFLIARRIHSLRNFAILSPKNQDCTEINDRIVEENEVKSISIFRGHIGASK